MKLIKSFVSLKYDFCRAIGWSRPLTIADNFSAEPETSEIKGLPTRVELV